jgi:CheY-like chemotaxis protein
MTSHRAKILVVDDDYLVCAFAAEVLSAAGYRLVTAHDAAEALARIDAEPDIDLLFTDIVMPGGHDGLALAELARQRRPDLRVLYTSGFAARLLEVDEAALLGPFMAKPYRPQQLTEAVAHALGTAPALAAAE